MLWNLTPLSCDAIARLRWPADIVRPIFSLLMLHAIILVNLKKIVLR
jgi:hypothetical protein